MKKSEVAQRLDGAVYYEGLQKLLTEIKKEIQGSDIVIVYGASDDLVEFEGAISEELGAPGKHYLDEEGLFINECPEGDDCPNFAGFDHAALIESFWCQDPVYTWHFETDIPHVNFRICDDDGEHFCRGIVFYLTDVAMLLGVGGNQ